MNSVTLYEDYIHTHWEGQQDLESVQKMDAEIVAAVKKFKSQNKPVLLLVSAHDSISRFDFGLFKETLKVMEQVTFNRVAFYGDIQDKVITLANTIAHSFKHDFEMKHFANKDEAIAWLKKYTNP